MNSDSFGIEILADGTIKLISDKVGAANHANAEQFFQYVARMTGGVSKRERRADAPQTHTHSHSHAAAEQHKH